MSDMSFLAVWFGLSMFVMAQVPSEFSVNRKMFGIYADNDSRYLKPNGKTDRHYSSGFRAVYSFDTNWQWLNDLFGHRDSENTLTRQSTGFLVGHHIYTPNHEDKPLLRSAREHRFAGWLYGGAFIQYRRDNTLHYVEWNAGVIGPSAKAKQIQQNIHNLLDSGKTIGWDTQLEDQPASDLTYTRLDRLWQNSSKSLPIDLISDAGLTAGSVHRHIEGGLTVRWDLDGLLGNDFGPARLLLPRTPAMADTNGCKNIYLFGRIAGRAVEYDRFLTGLTHKPLVGLGSVGITINWDKFQISYSQTFMTERFKQGDFEDSFGTLELAWTF